jgi:hypothetical protein
VPYAVVLPGMPDVCADAHSARIAYARYARRRVSHTAVRCAVRRVWCQCEPTVGMDRAAPHMLALYASPWAPNGELLHPLLSRASIARSMVVQADCIAPRTDLSHDCGVFALIPSGAGQGSA